MRPTVTGPSLPLRDPFGAELTVVGLINPAKVLSDIEAVGATLAFITGRALAMTV